MMAGAGDLELVVPHMTGETDVDLNRIHTASSIMITQDGQSTPGLDQHSPPLTTLSSDNPPGKHPKPQVIVRIRPSPTIEEQVLEVEADMKTIQIRVDREDLAKCGRQPKQQPSQPPGYIYFQADSVLEDSSQEDTFAAVAMDVVEMGMQGTPGMVVAVGPELSGKSFSLFGLAGKYQNRGIIAYALERLFDLKETSEQGIKIALGVIEVRRERIRDLLTLTPSEINDVGDRGPRGMHMEELDSLEHGIGLLMRALIGQKLIHQDPSEKYHTIVYLEIVSMSHESPGLMFFDSRLTFAEIASVASDTLMSPTTLESIPPTPFTPTSRPGSKTRRSTAVSTASSQKCLNPGYTTGPLAESIAVRRDIFTLERIFNRVSERQRTRAYFAKLEGLGLSMMASEKRRLSSGHDFRQSRLAHCLKDIMDSGTIIKILLHLRPDKAHLKASLEAMRFAKRAHLVTSNLDGDSGKAKSDKSEEHILQEIILEIAPDLIHPSALESLTVDKIKGIREQAVEYFDQHVNSMKAFSKEKVKLTLKNFRILWNFLWELELNLSLRKAEEEIKSLHGQKGRSRESGDTGEGGGDEHHRDHSREAVSKKSSKKVKKDKSKKKKQKTPNDADAGSEATLSHGHKRESTLHPDGGDAGHHPTSHHHDNHLGIPDGEEPEPHPRHPSVTVTHGNPRRSGASGAGDAPPLRHSLNHPRPSGQHSGSDPPLEHHHEPHLESHEAHDDPDPSNPVTPTQSQEALTRDTSLTQMHHHQGSRGSRSDRMSMAPHISPSTARHGFSKFKLPRHPQDISEEEMEMVSNDFDEMKKVARRQAVNLLKAGIGKPQWMS